MTHHPLTPSFSRRGNVRNTPSFSRRGKGVVFNFERTTRWIVIALGVAFIALVLALSILRLMYPYEIEWMEGAMVDHAIRVIAGQPIYTAPSLDFVAWLYPPLYYYAVAAVMKLTGIGFFAGRIVSFLSTLLTALALGWMVRRVTANRLFAFLTLALYVATYHATGFYFDIVRNDAFFTFLIVAAAIPAFFSNRAAPYLSGLILALAFFTKQQAIFFLPPLAIFFWFRNRKSGIAFAVTAVVLGVLSVLLLNIATHGWSNYYMFAIPHAKGVDFSAIRMLDVFPDYALGPFATSFIALLSLPLLKKEGASIAHDAGGWLGFLASGTGLLAMMSLAALVAGAFSLGNEGGYRNVMMPFVAFVLPLLPIALAEIKIVRPEFSRYVYLAFLFQFVALYFNPLSEKMLIASAHQRRGAEEFIRKLEVMPGDVFIPYHGYISRQAGKATHAQILAALDVLHMHDTAAARLQANFDSAYSQHRFSAIIMEESDAFHTDSIAHYTFSGRMLAEPNVNLTRVADQATRPEFVFVPK
ncbi:MAG TPA: glycosyltransferase family 39 protein [Candidatus Kapabacteria bacterium]|nr:glycosyltransferase family 39 protein [Candidatus Kapabacteria bacterium]